jgi:hypothetical protein
MDQHVGPKPPKLMSFTDGLTCYGFFCFSKEGSCGADPGWLIGSPAAVNQVVQTEIRYAKNMHWGAYKKLAPLDKQKAAEFEAAGVFHKLELPTSLVISEFYRRPENFDTLKDTIDRWASGVSIAIHARSPLAIRSFIHKICCLFPTMHQAEDGIDLDTNQVFKVVVNLFDPYYPEDMYLEEGSGTITPWVRFLTYQYTITLVLSGGLTLQPAGEESRSACANQAIIMPAKKYVKATRGMQGAFTITAFI